MTSKEALSDLLFLAIGQKNHTIKCKETIEKDLDRLESLERQNELLKKDLKEYQAYIKKGVEEHYADFMSDYDLLLQEYQELYKKLEILEILKKHYDEDSLLLSVGCFIHFYIYYKDTDFNKIKEWLENEKDNI